jgi:DnaK suppressor protein
MAKPLRRLPAAVEEPFDEREIRAMLEGRRSRLIDSVRRRTARIRDESTHATVVAEDDVIDAADLDFSLVELATETLRQIHRAIERLDRGQYGWCTRCHQRIATSRLRALPFAVRCRACQTAREEEARRTISPATTGAESRPLQAGAEGVIREAHESTRRIR